MHRWVAVVLVVLGCGGAAAHPTDVVVLPPPKDPPPTVTLADAGGPVEVDHCNAASVDGVTRVSATEIWVTRAFLEDAFATGNVGSSARIVPVTSADGGIAGLRMYGIRAGGTIERLGFLDGDELHTINGLSLTGVDSALAAYNSIRDAKIIVVGLTRRGVAVEHVIHICD